MSFEEKIEEESEADEDVPMTHQALYPFQARTPKEIDLRQGDPLVFIKQQGNDYVEVFNPRSKRKGLVPNSYIAIILVGQLFPLFPFSLFPFFPTPFSFFPFCLSLSFSIPIIYFIFYSILIRISDFKTN